MRSRPWARFRGQGSGFNFPPCSVGCPSSQELLHRLAHPELPYRPPSVRVDSSGKTLPGTEFCRDFTTQCLK